MGFIIHLDLCARETFYVNLIAKQVAAVKITSSAGITSVNN